MENVSSIARPYALAAFECARDSKQLSAWKDFLHIAACIANQTMVTQMMANPELPSAKLFQFFHEIISTQLTINQEQNNFLLLIATNQRLSTLPDIANRFNAYYAALEKMSHVRVITAVETPKEFQQTLSNVLSKRIQREITLQCEIDPSLIAGAIVHIGDRVIDGSVRGKLNRLLKSLTD